MSYLQTVSYRKGVSGKKVYTEEVVASTPTAAINAIKNRLATEIRVDRVLTSVPSNVEGAPPNV